MKIKELITEAVKTKKVYYGLIPGGRAGNKYKSGQTEIPLDVEEYEFMVNDRKIPDMIPNDGDIAGMLKKIANGETFTDMDVYGEGVFGMGSDPKKLELEIRREHEEG